MTATALPRALRGLRAVVFDMDGVLIDTEPTWRRVEIDVFRSVGLHLTEADCRQTMGMRVEEAVQRWYAISPWHGATVAEVVHRIVAGVTENVRRHGAPMPGAVEAVAVARARGLRIAVASSSPPALIDVVIDRLKLSALIDEVCSAVTELHGKPAPDVYLRAAFLLGVPPSCCLAVEDSVIGVLAARASGMPCLVIPDGETGADPRLSAATLRLSSLGDFDGARLNSISTAYFE